MMSKMFVSKAADNFVAPQGTNFRSEYELLPSLMSKALMATVDFLQGAEPLDAHLYHYADWWEHNGWGLHPIEGLLDFAALLYLVQSPEALLDGMPGDFHVFVGVTPHDFDWYLRFYLDPDAEEDERFGRFDLTLPTESSEQYKERVVKPLGLKMQEQDAATYYQSIQL